MFTMRNTDLISTLLKMNRAFLIKAIVAYAILLNHAVINYTTVPSQLINILTTKYIILTK